MFNTLKSKLFLLVLLSLSVLQFSLTLMMTHGPHEEFCAFDEHCLLQSVNVASEAVPPLLTVVLPVFFVLVFAKPLQPKEIHSFVSPLNFKYLQILEGIVKRE